MAKNSEQILYVKLFIIVVIITAFLSIFYKTYVLIQASSFKGNSFNLLILAADAHIVHMDQSEKRLVTVSIPEARAALINKSRAEQSAILGVLIDGATILPASNDASELVENFLSLPNALSVMFSRDMYRLDNVNEFDFIKFFWVTKLTPEDNRVVASGTLDDVFVDTDEDFSDDRILEESASIQIINATSVDGLGNMFSNALKNAGYNVVAVESSEKKNSEIVYGSDFKHSTSRLSNALRVTHTESNGSGIADITLILGPDILKR